MGHINKLIHDIEQSKKNVINIQSELTSHKEFIKQFFSKNSSKYNVILQVSFLITLKIIEDKIIQKRGLNRLLYTLSAAAISQLQHSLLLSNRLN